MTLSISIILAHPDPKSFNHAIAATVVETLEQNNHTTCFHDLCQEEFDPLLPMGEIAKDAALPSDVQRHCDEIAAADGIVIVHPNWWGQPPAILKGWIDRVIRPGVAYEFLEEDAGEGVPNGLLKARTAIVFNTSNTDTQREKRSLGIPWKPCGRTASSACAALMMFTGKCSISSSPARKNNEGPGWKRSGK